VIPMVLPLLDDGSSRAYAFEALSIFAGQAELREPIKPVIPKVFAFLGASDFDMQAVLPDTASRLAKHAELRESIRDAHVVDLLKSSLKNTGTDVPVKVLSNLAEHADLRKTIKATIPEVVDLLRDLLKESGLDDVQAVVVEALSGLARHVEFREDVNRIMLRCVQNDTLFSRGALKAVIYLIRHNQWSLDLLPIIQLALESLHPDESRISYRVEKLELLLALCDDACYVQPTFEVARIQSFCNILLGDTMFPDDINKLISMMMDYGALHSF
jgi:hypothetical protein